MTLSRIVKLTALILVICVGLYTAPSFISFDYLKADLSKKFAHDTGLDVKILGEIEADLFPTAAIIINQVRLDIDETNKIEIPKLTLNTNIVSLLMGDIKIKDIEVTGAQFTLQLVENLSKLPNNGFLRDVKFNNVSLVINQSSKFLNKINNINGSLKYSPSKSFGFAGSFNLKDFDYKLNMNLVSGKDVGANASSFHIASDFSEVKFGGDFNINDSQYDLKGKMSVKLFDHIKDDLEGTRVEHALLKDDLTASADIVINNREISTTNFVLSSKSISKIIGNFVLTLGATNEIASSLEGDVINLDVLLGGLNSVGAELTVEKLIRDMLMSFNFHTPHNLSGNIDFKLKELVFNEKAIKNIVLNSNILEEKVVLSELLMEIPGQSILEFTGIVSHNEVRPKFDGKLSLKIKGYKEFVEWLKLDSATFAMFENKELSLTSDIVIIPRNMRLDNTRLAWGDLRALGKFAFRHTGERRLLTQANMRVNYIDSDAMKLSEKVDNLLANLYASDFEKTGSKFYEITNDFRWLRDFPVNLNANVLIDRFKYKDINFPQLYFSSAVSPNNFAIEQMAVAAEGAAISGAVSLSTASIVPKVITNLVVGKMTSEFIDKIMPPLELLTSKQTELLSKNPDALATVVVGGANFYGIHNVFGDFKLKVNDYKSPALSFQNLELSAQSQEGIINIDSLTANVFKGTVDAVGNAVVASAIPMYSATFAFNNVQLAEFLRYYAGYDKLDGYVSLNGRFSSKGADRDTVFANLQGSLSLLGKKVVWTGFDIGEIVRLGDYTSSFADKQERLKYYSSNGQSTFDDMSGSIKIIAGMASLDDFKFSNTRVSGAYAAKTDLKNRLISSFARINFIPYGRAATMTLDIAGSGRIDELNPIIEAEGYLSFLQDNATSGNRAPASPLLRNQ